MSTPFQTVLLMSIVLAATLNTDAFVILQDENTTDHSGHRHLGAPEDVDALFPLLLNDTDSLPPNVSDNETEVGLGAQPSHKEGASVAVPITTDDGMTPGTDSGLFTPTTSDDVHTLPTETDKPHGSSGIPEVETSTGLDFPTGRVLPTETEKPHASSGVPGVETSTGLGLPRPVA
ncbi:hypothetical protein AAVH_38308 [Aphelenchoides avenae]|nr:hypothetical protein AAVH_38308 [Aphelenchus avenae]